MRFPAAASTHRRALLAALAAAALFAALAAMTWHTYEPLWWERIIIKVANHTPFPTRQIWIDLFEPLQFGAAVLVVTAVVAACGRRRLAIAGLAGCLCAIVTAQLVLKPLVHRVRATGFDANQHIVRIGGGDMFPSSHTTAAAALATFVFLAIGPRKRFAPLVFLLPAVVGFATISRHMHYPADVLAGFIVGPAVVLTVIAGLRAAERRRRQAARSPEPGGAPAATARATPAPS